MVEPWICYTFLYISVKIFSGQISGNLLENLYFGMLMSSQSTKRMLYWEYKNKQTVFSASVMLTSYSTFLSLSSFLLQALFDMVRLGEHVQGTKRSKKDANKPFENHFPLAE